MSVQVKGDRDTQKSFAASSLAPESSGCLGSFAEPFVFVEREGWKCISCGQKPWFTVTALRPLQTSLEHQAMLICAGETGRKGCLGTFT